LDSFTEQDTVILELFAGTGGVTASFKRHGFTNSVAVDKTKTAGALTSIIPLDLTKDEDQKTVFQWLQHPAVKGVFLAPPCGTASAARNIELPGEDASRPLRSFEEPDGISGLTGLDLQRASAANILYAFCAEVLELCCKLGKLFMSENPRNSLFWLTTTKLAGTEANGRNGPDLQPISNRLQQ
jgi:site-specific DNA-cytosine methylase